jgi:MFS family permease
METGEPLGSGTGGATPVAPDRAAPGPAGAGYYRPDVIEIGSQIDPIRLSAVSPWLVLAAVFSASVAAVMAQFAVPPLLPVLMDDFGIDIADASRLMSVFSITGLVLALPAGLVLQRFGPVVTSAVAMASVVAGSVLGILATDFNILLLSRAVQGIGVGLIGVVAPAVVAAVFTHDRRGTPMGVWAMWVPAGGVLMYLLAPSIAAGGGWQAVWWLTAIVAAAALLVVVGVLRAARLPRPGHTDAVADLRVGLAGRDVWLLAATFALFGTMAGSINTFVPTFLIDERGMDLTAAATMSALVLVGAGAGSVLSGVVSDRIGSRRTVYTASCVAAGLLVLLPFNVAGLALAAVLFVVGVTSGSIPAALFASVPDAMPEPRLTGAGMAALMLGQNAGFVIGPALFTALLPTLGWASIGVVFAVVGLAAAAVGWRARVP